MYKLLVLPLFFAATSAGLIGAPLASPLAVSHGLALPSLSYAHAPVSYAHAPVSYAHAPVSYAHAPLSYAHSPLLAPPLITKSIASPYAPLVSSPYVKHISPLALSAPVVTKTVLPAATSYANTYKISQSVPLVHHAVASPIVSHAVASPLYGHSPLLGHAVASPVLSHAVASPLGYGTVLH